MKKFLLSLCVLAAASVCVFMTSCKDDEGTNADYVSGQTQINKAEAKAEMAKAKDATLGAYTYELNGKTYTSEDALIDAINKMEPGAEYKITTTNSNGQQATTQGVLPAAGSKGKIEIAFAQADGTPKKAQIDVTSTFEYQHSGGSVK